MKKAIQFGAGNIGRGFIGYLLHKSGYEVTFVDINDEILNAINKDKTYKIFIRDVESFEESVDNILALNSLSDEVIKAISECDIITTAVGPTVLSKITNSILKGLQLKKENNINTNLTIIACENMIGATDFLKDEILKLADNDMKEYIEKFISFPNCSVDRIVPPIKNNNILDVTVEKFFEWNVEKGKFKKEIPKIYGMNLVDNLQAFLERKLFTLNTGHAMVAYLGSIKGYNTIDEAILDENIQKIVRSAMQESGKAICLKYNLNLDEHFKYIEKIINRFKNKYLEDDLIRVGREPLRKLSSQDRLIKPLNTAILYNISVDNLLIGISGALHYFNKSDEQSVTLQNCIKDLGLENTIKKITEIKDKNIINKIIENYNNINNILNS
ncbi:mannitol-1-phosphate 5-dehydrogenase [[Clostridium] colinum]|uniref:mannitol-1-phosphate 5-dehydrogenase n=1 Tax=[Clostridium] colinum TaxID=36835 RepID=UPI002023D137|nr:mannitol-1-phosphate 5-dehydrogenase [[Clostridium] colinum]